MKRNAQIAAQVRKKTHLSLYVHYFNYPSSFLTFFTQKSMLVQRTCLKSMFVFLSFCHFIECVVNLTQDISQIKIFQR